MKVILSIDGLSFKDFNLSLMPNLKMLLEKDYTFKKVETIFPSVTWAIHTTASTGVLPKEHSVFGNMFYENGEKCYWENEISKEEVVKAPTFYDEFYKQGKKIASVCWPLTQGAKSIELNIPEFYSQEEFDKGSSEVFYNELIEKGFPMKCYGHWSNDLNSVILQDELTQQIMEYIIENKNVDVLMGHYLSIDTMEHYYGCGSSLANFSIKYVDGQISKLINCLKKENKWENCDLIIFSDHGQININNNETWDIEMDLRKTSLINDLKIVDDGGCLHIYVTNNNKKEEIESFFENNNKVYKLNRMEKTIDREPNYQVALKKGVVTKSYGKDHVGGATHGFHPENCDEMNSFVIYKKSKKSYEHDKNLELINVYNLILEN